MRIAQLLLCVLGAAGVAFGEVVEQENFETPDALIRWSNDGVGKASVVEVAPNAHVLRVETGTQSDHLLRLPLPIEEVRGKQIALSARVKADNIVKAPEAWHGMKVMLVTNTPAGTNYQSVSDLAGTFDWKTVGLSAQVPPDATEAVLILGLGEASGVAWFDDLEISVTASPRDRPSPQPALLPPEKLDRRSEVPRLRGVMYGPGAKEEDLRTLAAWKGNLIRWQFFWYDGGFPDKRLDLANYDKWLDETVAAVDRMIPLCRELGLRLVIDLHTPPGGTESRQMEIFRTPAFQQKFIETWDKLAGHFKNEPVVWAYDLLNEPVEGKVADGLMDWRTLAEHVAKRVRAIDEKHAIIVEPGPFGGWDNLPYFPPLDVPGIVYSVHMYDPLRFTHQGVMDGMTTGVSYPGEIDGVYWDKERLRKTLEPVREYQKDYNVPIYIGEFSAARWAPGESATNYLRDCIAIFEEYGWDWSYHAFREWHAWNVELGPDAADQSPSKTPTSRERLLREGFKKN